MFEHHPVHVSILAFRLDYNCGSVQGARRGLDASSCRCLRTRPLCLRRLPVAGGYPVQTGNVGRTICAVVVDLQLVVHTQLAVAGQRRGFSSENHAPLGIC